MKILILCTGNSCRSQMAEGILKSLDSKLEVHSAGTKPAEKVSSKAVKVLSEIGVDISNNYPKDVNEFIGQDFDYVITVCDNAKEICPVFTGNVQNRLHLGFEDPYEAVGSDEEVLDFYRKIRDEIIQRFTEFYVIEIMNKSIKKSIGFIGAGRITKIILRAFEISGFDFSDVKVSDINKDNLDKLKHEFPKINVYHNNNFAPLESDLIFIALHPPHFIELLNSISNQLDSNSIIVSLSPKIKINDIKDKLNGFDRIIRMNPNAPTIVGKGFCPTVFSNSFSYLEKKLFLEIFSAFGECPIVDEYKIESFAIVTAMGVTYFDYQIYELIKLAKTFKLDDNDIKTGLTYMFNGLLNTFFSDDLSEQEVLDLVPTRPLKEIENELIKMYDNNLNNIYNKLTQ